VPHSMGPHPIRPQPHPHLPGKPDRTQLTRFEAQPLHNELWARATTSCAQALPNTRTWFVCGHAEKAPLDRMGIPIR
jgi:hypothetical protein